MTQPSQPPGTPVVLELAPLPREQTGPFILLGLDKTADQKQVEAHWAKRVIWARKKQVNVPLEDVNWARDALSEFDKRLHADASSLNIDTTDGVLKQLEQRYNGEGAAPVGCRPIDVEKSLSHYEPDVEVPSRTEIRDAITIPDVPREFPAVRLLLEQFAREPLDPWNLEGCCPDE